MKYHIVHTTGYHYSEPASLSQNELFITPRTTPCQNVLASQLTIKPEPQYLQVRTDYFGNTAHVFMVQHPHEDLSITVDSFVETAQTNLPAQTNISWEETAERLYTRRTVEDRDASQFIFASPLIDLLPKAHEFAKVSFTPRISLIHGAKDLISRIFHEFTYDKAATSIDTTVSELLDRRKGVCQDFSHLAISCLRSLGLAARYVSGYLETLPPPGKPKLIGSDASHAWISLYVPDYGWLDLDPTNNSLCREQHVTLAWGRDYGDVTPVKGVVMGGGTHTLSVSVDVNSIAIPAHSAEALRKRKKIS